MGTGTEEEGCLPQSRHKQQDVPPPSMRDRRDPGEAVSTTQGKRALPTRGRLPNPGCVMGGGCARDSGPGSWQRQDPASLRHSWHGQRCGGGGGGGTKSRPSAHILRLIMRSLIVCRDDGGKRPAGARLAD
ncbi:hypothetical protein AAFF_G00434320 [Aldrovandia affinis]|uniref:Uncharacterized protein n=1 Tax=Aldrovandia affinis TaxID=143900 RepID=A0AAD7S8I3_9TELE|nr:hypothetical protein AAFF_G00434320 [Aldrovandia affinis]